MSTTETALRPALTRTRPARCSGRRWDSWPLTAAFFALGAYLGRDMSYGWGVAVSSSLAFVCLFGHARRASQRSEQLAIVLLLRLRRR